MSTSRFAIFVDLENCGAKAPTLNNILDKVKIRGDILLGKVYGYTDRFSELKELLLSNTFTVVPSLRHGVAQKNNADILLVLDALEVAYTNPLIDSFCIVSGDSDYTPLVGRLKSMGKFVLGMNPIAMGLLKSPREQGADIAVGEAQPLGLPMSFGGPYIGFMATTQKEMRKMPGRIVGETVDSEGNRAYVLTLQAREQHIRRERATSNICSNQALCALNALIYLTLLGPQGIQEVASLNVAHAHELKDLLLQYHLCYFLQFDGPFYNEFVLELNRPACEVIEKLAAQGISAGFDLGRVCESLKNCLLVCVTETKTKQDLQTYVNALRGC